MECLDEEQLDEQGDGDGGEVASEHGEGKASLGDRVPRVLVHDLGCVALGRKKEKKNGLIDQRKKSGLVLKKKKRVTDSQLRLVVYFLLLLPLTKTKLK